MNYKRIAYRIALIISLFFCSINETKAHWEWVHQYIVVEAWKLLVQKYPSLQNTIMAQRIGSVQKAPTDLCTRDWLIGSVTYGAWREEVTWC